MRRAATLGRAKVIQVRGRLIALGFLQLAGGLGFEGLWLALIGLFLVNAATAEEQQTQLGTALHGIKVGDVMSKRPVVVADPDGTVTELVDRLVLRERLSTYPLVDGNGRFAGLVTLNRIRRVTPQKRAMTSLREIACPPDDVPKARPEDPLIELLPRMGGCADGRAMVFDPGGRLVGVITPSDISWTMQTVDLRAGETHHAPRGADLAVGPHSQRPSPV
ncbi:CBS domain-containing protein [Microbispora sp. NPDC049125]|uniref:CBS domain-containing protein n=1 Tax=Microbispora sp. NPDC049125 TaxID=3154929 RepID=UPI0034670DB8